MEKRRAHRQALTHPVREALDQLVSPGRQVKQLQQLSDARRKSVGLVDAEQTAVEGKELGRRQLLVQERPVRNDTERALGPDWVAREVRVVDHYAA